MPIDAPAQERKPATTEEMDDIESYVATFDDDERRRLAAAEAAIDVAILLHRARMRRGLSQSAAARRAGLRQQAVSRLERPAANPQLGTIQAYLGALGYALELRAIDLQADEAVASVLLPSEPPGDSARPTRPVARH